MVLVSTKFGKTAVLKIAIVFEIIYGKVRRWFPSTLLKMNPYTFTYKGNLSKLVLVQTESKVFLK